MAVYVMKSGVNPNSIGTPNTTEGNTGHNVNFNTPTNPIIHNTVADADTYICAEIRTDDGNPTTMVKQNTGAYDAYLENLENTAGYRVKCYDNTNGGGQRLNGLTLATYDYFILLYADDNSQHHFAKITALKTDDVSGDALEFTPKFGNEIPKGTKFSVFRGAQVTDTNIVAVTAGLLVDSNDIHNESLVCARPLFYFYDDRLNKKNELDHNMKYKLCYERDDETSIDLDDTISVFITQPDYGLQIVDKSRFGLHVEIIDNRRTMDDPAQDGVADFYYGKASITTHTLTNYDSCFPNIRRRTTDATSGSDWTGPYTYLHYEDSPMKVNNPITIISSKVYDSIGDRSGYAESKFVDSRKSFSSKYSEGDSYVMRQTLKSGDVSDWFELPITIKSIASHATTFNIPNNYDLRRLFDYNEEIKMGNYIGTISNIGAPNYTNLTQLVTTQAYYRLNTASATSSVSANPASVDDIGYRRTWSPATKTFMIDFPLQTEVDYTFSAHLDDHPISASSFTFKMNNVTLASYTESRLYNSYLILADTNYELTESRVVFDDKEHSYLRLEPPRSHYRTVAVTRTSYDYSFGKFSLELEIFTGTIEEIKNTLEHGQPIFEVSGRNNLAKLISPIINKNTLYIQDMIYSSKSPLQKITKLTSASGDVQPTGTVILNYGKGTYSSGTASTYIPVNYAPTNLIVGDYLFTAAGNFIGEVESINSSTRITLVHGSFCRLLSSSVLYKQTAKPYSFTKSLLSSSKNTKTFGSLTGASNRGAFFTSGVSLDSSGDKAANLAGTSSSTNENAVGNHLNSIQNIREDKHFQAVLKDEYGSTTFTSDVVNALSDFVVVSINKEDEGTTIELAPRVPLFLGRVDDFDYYDSDDMTTTDTTMVVSYAETDKPYIRTIGTTINTHFIRNDPVYIKDTTTGITSFIGYFIMGIPEESASSGPAGSGNNMIVLDREYTSATSGTRYEIHKRNAQYTTGMYFLNRPSSHILQLASSISGSGGLLPFNVDTYRIDSPSVQSSYINRYNSPYYRIIDIEEGQYDTIEEMPRLVGAATDSPDTGYYNNPSKTNNFALAYRFNPAFITSPITTNANEDEYTTYPDKQGIFERRGNRPSRGTNFDDYYLSTSESNKFIYPKYNATQYGYRTWERNLRQMDAKVSRNFLFVSSDLLPCTSKRTDSLFKSGRDLTDFNIMLRTKGATSNISQTHTKYLGAGKSISNIDTNTTIAGISTAPDISSLKRFSMLRLVEMTLDWHFNSVDAENLPDKDKTLLVYEGVSMGDIFPILENTGVLLNESNIAAGTDSILTVDTVDATTKFSVGDDVYIRGLAAYGETTSIEGEKIGKIKTITSTLITLESNNLVAINNNDNLQRRSTIKTSGYTTGGSAQIELNGTPVNLTTSRDYQLWSPSGYYVGVMVAFSGAVLTMNGSGSAGPFINEDFSLKTGIPLFAIQNDVATDIQTGKISGHGDKDTFVGMPPENPFHMLKGAVINSSNLTADNSHTISSDYDGYAEDDVDAYHESYLTTNNGTTNIYSIRDLFHTHKHTAEIALPPTFPPIAATKSALQESDSTAISLATSTSEGATSITVSGTPSLTAGWQYDLFLTQGFYLGRTAKQTYSSTTIQMETSYYKTEMDAYSGANLVISKALSPNESLITTHKNTHKSEVIRALSKNKGRYLFNETLPVILDRYSIEDGGQSKLSAGLVSSEIEETIQIDGNLTNGVSIQPHKIMLRTKDMGGFARYLSITDDGAGTIHTHRNSDGASPYIADGGYMLFKPFLRLNDAAGVVYSASSSDTIAFGDSTTIRTLKIKVDNLADGSASSVLKNHNQWLNFAPNLTGCYLVSNSGYPYGSPTSTKNDEYYSDDTAYSNAFDSMSSFADKIPDNIHYVISHTINRAYDYTEHHIIVDNFSSAFDKVYRVMRVAENTFYDYSPKDIVPYVPSARYTKMSYSDEMYGELKSYMFDDVRNSNIINQNRKYYDTGGSSGSPKNYSETGFNEAISSMYVIADPDRQGTGNFLTYRSPSNVFGSLLNDKESFNVAMDDGKNTIKSNIQIQYNSTNRINEMKFSEMGALVGAVSVGEIFSITTIENIKGDYTDAHIGSTVNVAYESDTLLNDLFESEGLTFTEQDNTQYPLFISPEFKGTDLMAAANFVLERKNKALLYDNGFKLRDANSELFRPNIFITDLDANYLIKSIKSEKGLFEMYNEIIVYGRNLKSTRKNLRSIKKHGKKSLTIHDNNLYTQYDVDRRASRLLRLHSRPSNRITIEVKSNDIFLLRPADIISLEVSSQNISREDYVVLEIEYSLANFSKLVLGKVTKGMVDRFSELLVENKNINSSLRPKTFKEPSISTDIFDSFKIKEIRLKIRKRATGSGSFTLGFSTALNTGSTAMGFVGGASITYTDLVDEVLT